MHNLHKYILKIRITYDVDIEQTAAYTDFVKNNPNEIVREYNAVAIDNSLLTYVRKLLTIISRPAQLGCSLGINGNHKLTVNHSVSRSCWPFIDMSLVNNSAIYYTKGKVSRFHMVQDNITIGLHLNGVLSMHMYESDWLFGYMSGSTFLINNIQTVHGVYTYQKFNKPFNELNHDQDRVPEFKLLLNFTAENKTITVQAKNILVTTNISDDYKRQVTIRDESPTT